MAKRKFMILVMLICLFSNYKLSGINRLLCGGIDVVFSLVNRVPYGLITAISGSP